MRIAVVTRDMPLPPGTGLNLVIHNLLQGLAEKHEIRVFILNRGYYGYRSEGSSGEAEFPYEFEECPKDVPQDAGNGSQNGHGKLTKLSRAAKYYGVNPKYVEWLNQRIADYRADRIVGFDYNLTPYFGLLTSDVPKILNVVDSEILYYRNQIAAGHMNTGVIKHLVAAALVGRESLRKCNAVVTVSPADTRNIQKVTGTERVYTVPNGVDHEKFAPDATAERKPNQAVFCGSLSFLPNVQAIDWFVTKCWPHVLQKKPDAEILIVGKSPPADLKPRLESFRGVRFIGYVDDIRTYIRGSAVSVAPMVSGSGIKNKILEAWAMATPVVATPVAVRGLSYESGKNILVSDSEQEFANHVVSLMEDPSRAASIGAAGRDHAVQNYSWEKSREDFNAIVESFAPITTR